MIENVIIADDSSTARMIIKRCLEIGGCTASHFYEAANGEEALEIAREKPIDLLVTDLNMPTMDGRTLLKYVKASPKLTTLPVLVISSASNEAVKEELLKLGAHAVVNKPVSPAIIAEIIKGFDSDQEQDELDGWG